MHRMMIGGLGLFLALSLFLTTTVAAAEDYPYFGPQTPSDDYLYWGNADYPKTQKHGISLTVLETSISFQSVIASAQLDYVPNSTIVDQRNITKFHVIANGRVVDSFEPSWDQESNKWRTNYPLRIALEDWNIGSLITLQIVATTHEDTDSLDYQPHYVVAWSQAQGPYQLKPLPVIDRDAIEVLESILAKLGQIAAKLDELKMMIEMKMNQLTEAVEKIYTPTPQAESALNAAMDNLTEKLPMTEMLNEIEDMNEVMKDTMAKLKEPGSELALGGDIQLIPMHPEYKYKLLDLTRMKDEVLLFRKIMEAAMWVYFFYMLLEKVTPKPRL